MASNIDVTLPIARHPSTATERENWQRAYDEITALQTAVEGIGTASGISEALGYVPYDAANPDQFQTAQQLEDALISIQGVLTPLMDGDASTGIAPRYAREDHVHPVDLSRYPATSNPADYQSGAQVTSALAASLGINLPLIDGIAAPGISARTAREDHVHPTDTTRYAAANPSRFQSDTQVIASINAATAYYVPLSSMAVPLGVASLDANGRVVSTQLPAAATGSLNYKGGWNPATNTPAMTSGAHVGGVVAPRGDYYVITVAGTTAAIDGITTWVAGDWINSNGVTWERVQANPAPYLPLVGGSLTGPLILMSGDTLGSAAQDPRLPAMSYYWQDSAGLVTGGIDPQGILRWGAAYFANATLNAATISSGSATLTALNAVTAAISGSLTTADFTASGNVTFSGGNPLSLPAAIIAGDAWQPFDPRIVGYSYGWFDPAANFAGGITNAGKLVWGDVGFNSLSVVGALSAGTITATGITTGTMAMSGPLTVAGLIMPFATFSDMDPRISGISYAWQDSTGAIAAGLAHDGTMMMGMANVQAGLILGFDATDPNHALRKSYADTAYINTSGGRMLGQLLLQAGSPTLPEAAANKAYVDASAASGGGGGLTGLAAQKDFPYPPLRDPKRDYGAAGNGVADDSAAINACVAAALAAGERAIAINDTYNCPSLDWSIAQVLLIGIGKLLNANHQMFVIPPWAPPAPTRFNSTTLTLRNHCPKAAAKLRAQQPTDTPLMVVVTGESTYAPATSATVLPIFWARAQFAMSEANPGKKITYINRGIGGTRWSHLDSTPDFASTDDPTVSWYTDGNRAWLEYIHDLNPDIVMIGFSGNDGIAFRLQNMLSVLSKMAAWANPPEVILATSNPYAQQYLFTQTNTVTGWEGQQAAACIERSWAISKGLGLIDTSRAVTVHAKGFDPHDIPLKRDFNVTGNAAGRKALILPFTWPTRCWGYSGFFYVPSGAAWTAMGNEVQFELGGTWGGGTSPNTVLNPANGGCILRIGRDPTTKQMYYEVDTSLISAGAWANTIHVPKTFVPGWFQQDNETVSWMMAVSGSRLVVQSQKGSNFAQDQWTANILVHVPRYNQPWTPKITCAAGGTVTSQLWFEKAADGIPYAASGLPDQRAFYFPSMTEHEAYGSPAADVDNDWSGGGVGHDSALKGHWALQCAMSSADWGA